MKVAKLLLTLSCLSALLCGCQEVPEGVKENMEEYGENQQKKESEITYCSIEELRNAEIPDIDTGSIRLPESVDFSDVEGAALLHLSCYKDFTKESNVEKYAELFGVDKDGFVEGITDITYGKTKKYENKEDQEYVCLLKSGGLVHMGGWAYGEGLVPGIYEKGYDLRKDDITDVEVELRDGAANLSELCGETEAWLEENMPMEGLRQQVANVVVRRPEGEEGTARRVAMCVEYDYQGIHFNNHTNGRMEKEEGGYEEKLVTESAFTMLDFDTRGIPQFYSRNEGFGVDGAEPLEQVVSFESAVRILSEKISGFGVFHITDVLPLYDLYPDFDAGVEGRKIEARPVYAFLVEQKGEKRNETFGLVKPGWNRYFFFVDMETGELTTNLELK